jgi:hypothetical protein
MAVTALSCGTASVEPRVQPPSFRLAVLDLAVPEQWRKAATPDPMDKERRGWWFGSETRFHNPGLGRVAGDAFAQELARLPFISLVSRTDIKYRMADLLQRLHDVRDKQRRELDASLNPADNEKARKIRQMTEADYENELQNVSAVAIAKELDADRVLTGRIHDAAIVHNRTTDFYHSYVDLEVRLVDVDTGKVLWSQRQMFKRRSVSTPFLLEEAAHQMVEKMKREHFYQ